jgi:hypothetical protein
MREKLIELLYEARMMCEERSCAHCEYADEDRCMQAMQADHIIANGVTVQKKGEWEIRTDYYDCEYAVCSACGSEFYDGENDTVDQRPNFCLECGADMRGEEHEID